MRTQEFWTWKPETDVYADFSLKVVAGTSIVEGGVNAVYNSPEQNSGGVTVMVDQAVNLPTDRRHCEVRNAKLVENLTGKKKERVFNASFLLLFFLNNEIKSWCLLNGNEFLKWLGSAFYSVCTSLVAGVINGTSHSICSSQALLFSLPPWTTLTLLSPSQQQLHNTSYGCTSPVRLWKQGRRGIEEVEEEWGEICQRSNMEMKVREMGAISTMKGKKVCSFLHVNGKLERWK